VTLSRKGANSPTRARKLRSTGTKAKARVSNRPNSLSELKKQLEARTRELAANTPPPRLQYVTSKRQLEDVSKPVAESGSGSIQYPDSQEAKKTEVQHVSEVQNSSEE
jgi:hypothetical protein